MGLFKPTDLLPVILKICDCICNFVCRVPQIIRLIKLKRSEAISTTYWMFCIVSCFLCINFYILTGNIPFLTFLHKKSVDFSHQMNCDKPLLNINGITVNNNCDNNRINIWED